MPPVLVYIFFWLSTTFLCVIIVITYQKFYFCYLISSLNNFLQSIVLQFYGLFMLFVLNQFQNRGKNELLLFFPWSLSLDLNYYPKFLHIMAQIPNLLVCYWFVCILCFNELDVTRAWHVSKLTIYQSQYHIQYIGVLDENHVQLLILYLVIYQ